MSGKLSTETHICALYDLYTFGPTFGEENSKTSRHFAEFWMVELEDHMENDEAYATTWGSRKPGKKS